MEQTFKERLRSLLDNKGLYVKELAAKTNMSKRSIDNYLGGQTSMPPADVAVKIAKALDTTVEYLVTGKAPALVLESPKANTDYTRLINKLALLDDIDKTIVETLIDSLIDKKRSEVSAMETSRIG